MPASRHKLSLTRVRRTAVPSHTLMEAEEAYLAHHHALNHSPATIDHYQWTFTDLHRFLAATQRPEDVGVLTVQTLQALHKWLVETPLKKEYRGGRTRSARSIAGRMKDLRAFVKWLADEEWIDKAPKVPIPKVPKLLFPILSDTDLVTLFSCPHLTARGEQAIRNRAIVALLLDTAIRRAEVVALTPRSLHLDHDQITVVGKGSKERIVPVSHGTKALLVEWLKIRGTDDGPLFWLGYHGIKMLMRRIQSETGLHLYCHKLRHTSASKLVRGGMDLHTVKRILGHEQLATVEVYLTLDTEDIRAKHAAASPFESVRQLLPTEVANPKKRRRLSLG